MSTINRNQLSDLRGAARLAFDATTGITALVEKMHHTIQLRPAPLGDSRADVTRGITGLVYRSVREATHLIGRGVDAGLAPLVALLPDGRGPSHARRMGVDRQRRLRRSPRAHGQSARHRGCTCARAVAASIRCGRPMRCRMRRAA